MLPTPTGSFRLFRVFGITVYLHWLWFVIVVIVAQMSSRYSNQAWAFVEYLSLFGIVLLHEFGHALACKSVGGQADRIILWPLGGVAFVQPPPRPGATLWSIAAGPLVNVALIPVTTWLVAATGWGSTTTDVGRFAYALWAINLILLGFNLLPIYPLDGGQIVQSLLWFVIGRARSLWITAGVGIVVGVAAAITALTFGDLWLVIMAAFIASRAWHGFRVARLMIQMQRQGVRF